MNEFKINDFLILKLEEGKTNIYVNGEQFEQCKFLMLDIPLDEIYRFDEIDSIDEAADILGWRFEGQMGVKYEIDPETEFWGHCSNLQAWYENNYDTRLLHSNLSFPLLKKLKDVGDPLAMKVLIEEITSRFESGYPTVITCIVETYLLDCLNMEEKRMLIGKILSRLPDEKKYDGFTNLIETIKNEEWVEEHFLIFLEHIDKFPDDEKYDAYIRLFEVTKITGLRKEYLPAFFAAIEKFPNDRIYWIYDGDYFKYFDISFLLNSLYKITYLSMKLFNDLIESTKGTELMQEKFHDFLSGINKLPNRLQYNAFLKLIKATKSTGVLVKHFSLFEKNFSNLLIDIRLSESPTTAFGKLVDVIEEIKFLDNYDAFIVAKFPDLRDTIEKFHISIRYYRYKKFFALIKETKLGIEIYPDMVEMIDVLPIRNKLVEFCYLLYTIKRTKYLDKFYSLIELRFSDLMNEYEKSSDIDKYLFLIKLIPVINGTELIHEYYSFINTNFPDFLNVLRLKHKVNKYSTYLTFIKLIYALYDTELIQSKFLYLLDVYGNFSESYNQFRVFGMLMDVIKGTKLKSKYYLLIESKFLDLLNEVDSKNNELPFLIEAIKGTKFMSKYLPLIQNKVLDLLNEDDIEYNTFTGLIDAIKHTKLMRKNICTIINRFPEFHLKPHTKVVWRRFKKEELSKKEKEDMYNDSLMKFSISSFILSLILNKLYKGNMTKIFSETGKSHKRKKG